MKITTTLNVPFCEPELRDGKPVLTKDGQPKYRIGYKVEKVIKAGTKEYKEEHTETMTSLIELKPGVHTVELNVFAIAQGAKANIYYQVKCVVDAKSQNKKAE